MNQQFQTYIMESLDALGEELGVAITHLYEICIREAYILGWTEIMWFIFLAGTGIFGLYISYKLCKKGSRENEDFFVFGGIMIGIFAFAFTCWGFADLMYGIRHIANPEFYIIQKVLPGK